jgi:hypothetical protein
LGRREIEHILQLSHVADLDAVEDVHTFLYSLDRIAVEVRRPLLEFGEVFHRPQAPFRSMSLLIEHAAQARRVETETPVLRPVVGVQVELPCGSIVDLLWPVSSILRMEIARCLYTSGTLFNRTPPICN